MSFVSDQLQKGEEIKLQTNQHIVVLLKPILVTVLVFCALTALMVIGVTRWENPNAYWLMLLLVPFIADLARRFIIRANEEYIITNRRVIKQQGVFTKTSFDSPLDKINNIFHRQTLFGRLFNYGNVGLETASEMGLTEFQYIPDPLRFKNTIVSVRDKKIPSDAGPSLYGDRENAVALLERLAKLREQNAITEEEYREGKRKLLDNL